MGDQAGFLKRSYRIISQNRIKVENIRINEGAQELIFKTVKDGKESEVEHVWTLVTNLFVVRSMAVRHQTKCVFVGSSHKSKPTKFLTRFWQPHLECEFGVIFIRSCDSFVFVKLLLSGAK